jgi:hypothetical protein
MNKRTTIMLSLGIVVLGLLIPIVPRLVVPLIRPYPYDDPFLGAGIVRVGRVLAWNALPFVLLALVAYIALTRAAPGGRRRAMVLSAVWGALVPGIVVGLLIHTPNSAVVGANIGAGLYPLYMLVLMPIGAGLGALLARLVRRRGASSPTGTLGT